MVLIVSACLIVAPSVWPHPSSAQDVADVLSRIDQIIIEEDVDGLIGWASESLEIAVFGSSRSYSLAQSRYVLRDFFDHLEVVKFSVTEFTESETGLFVEGSIDVPASQYPVRVYLQFRQSGGGWVLREVLFERMSE